MGARIIAPMDPPQKAGDSSLYGFLRLLRRRWLVLATCVILAPAVALGLALSQEKQYSASASLFFRSLDLNLNANSPQDQALPPSPDPTREAETNLTLASLQTVAARTSAALHGRLTPEQVASKVEVQDVSKSDVAKVTATDHRPALAALLANTYAAQYIAFRRASDQSALAAPIAGLKNQIKRLSPAQRASASGQALLRRLEDLKAISNLQTGNAELVQRATVPTSPSAPHPIRDAIIGLVLGVLLGVGLVLIFDLLDQRLRDESDIETTFGLPVLGQIPESRALRTRWTRFARPDPLDVEAFRMVYANLRFFDVSTPLRSVVVSSAGPAEGKTTLAWHLSMAAASTGTRVLFVDADLRHPGERDVLAGRGEGLSRVLAGHTATDSVRPARKILRLADDRGVPAGLDVLTAGPQPPNPAALFASSRMHSLLESWERDYDLVVIDTPPIAVVSDAAPLVGRVDGVVLVAAVGGTRRNAARGLAKQLEKLDANMLGVVINRVSRPPSYDYARYYESDKVDWSIAEPVEEPPVGSPQEDLASSEEHLPGEPRQARGPVDSNGAPLVEPSPEGRSQRSRARRWLTSGP
jgi:polysaccharide biosynthesis transport protein